MLERSKEEEAPISPKADSPVPEIFSTKKIFFLNSSCSGSHRSDIPHIESGYCPRDEVSRRLFNPDRSSCDCDCVSDGCFGCLRRNRQVFFKGFVLALGVALVLLLFGSLSYNLTRNKDDDESFEVEKIEFISHYHEYIVKEESKLSGGRKTDSAAELDLPVPFYGYPNDYEGVREDVEPIRLPLLNQPHSITQPALIYDVREPGRERRSIPISKENVVGQESKVYGKRQSQSLVEELNGIEEGMEVFWGNYFKKGRTVFQPFSLSTPAYSTPQFSDDDVMDDTVIEDELKNIFLSPTIERKVTSHDVNSVPERAGVMREDEEAHEEKSTSSGIKEESQEGQTETAYDTDAGNVVSSEPTSMVKETGESEVTERVEEDDGSKFRARPFFPLLSKLSGVLRPNQRNDMSPDSSNSVKGISLSDAKKLKKEKRKRLLLNSRVVGGSSDVRLPTGPDSSKPIVNAFETLKTNQQLSFTPSAASQFILPYQMCLFASPFPGPRPLPQVAQPRTFSFGPLVHPLLGGAQPPKSYQPAQQNFLSFNINNFPNAAPPRTPSGSGLGFPVQQHFSHYPYTGPGPNRQPIFCTYLQPPLFQFPTVPGTADFIHAKCLDCQDDARKAAFNAKDTFLSGRDELCSSDGVSCIDGSGCIPLTHWCDNRVHCKDASDEVFCSCRERIASDRLCDGYVDCPHGEDETGCFDCPKSSFTCESPTSQGSCIPLSLRCDGIRDCASGADEMDCSALFFSIRQNDSYHVSQVSGYLHHNWKGDWFPVCVELGDSTWAKEACAAELGYLPTEVEVKFAAVPEIYRGPFIVRQEDGSVSLQDHCKGHISTYVKCPSLKCGTRIESYSQEFESRFLQNRKVEDLRLKREETGRVVGGRESEPRAWPWAIALYKDGAFHCGGVILDEYWVLTAAHCMEQYWKYFYEVRSGMLRRFSFSAMEQVRSVADVIVHEDYDQTIMSNDLALLRIREPFHFNRWVRPGCLPNLRDGFSKFYWGPAPGTRCIAVGWGALKERGIDPDQLREVEIPILTRCKHKEDLVGEEICAGKAEGGKDTCQGDSGGPLLCRDSSFPPSWYVAGIVSHGEGCARPGEPGAYTRVSLFIDWITANANDLQLPVLKPSKTCPGLRCTSGSRLCIPPKWVCNGFTDCLEAEDERNCTAAFDFERQRSDWENKEVSPSRISPGGVTEEEMLEAAENLRQDLKSIQTTSVEIPSLSPPVNTATPIRQFTIITTEASQKSTTATETIPEFPESTIGISVNIEKSSTEMELEIPPITEELLSKQMEVLTETSAAVQSTNPTSKLFPEAEGIQADSFQRTNINGAKLELNESFTVPTSIAEAEAVEEDIPRGEIEKRETTKTLRIITEMSTPLDVAEETGSIILRTKSLSTHKSVPDENVQSITDTTIKETEIVTDLFAAESDPVKPQGIVNFPTTAEDLVNGMKMAAQLSATSKSTVKPVKSIANASTILPDIDLVVNETVTTPETKELLEITTDISIVTGVFDKVIEVASENFATVSGLYELSEVVNEDLGEAEVTTPITQTEMKNSLTISEYLETTSEDFENEKYLNTERSQVGILVGVTEREVKSEFFNDEYKAGEEEKIEGEKDKSKENEEEADDENENESEFGEGEEKEKNSEMKNNTDEDISDSSEETTELEKNPVITARALTIGSESTINEEEQRETMSTETFLIKASIDPRLTVEKVLENLQGTEISTTPHVVRRHESIYHNLYGNPEEVTEYQTDLTDVVRSSFHNTSAYFQCSQIVQSVLQTYKCDGVEDCEDGTDEENCTCAQALMNSAPKLLCDGKVDCPDRSDEVNCGTCPKGRYLCRLSRECIPSEERCNGEKNCEFGEDEERCLGLSPAGEEEEFVQTEGFFMTNLKGIWTLECQEKSPLTAGTAIEACAAVGTIGYDKYENRSAGLGCTGLYVTCSRNLKSSLDGYQRVDGSYRWPWHAFVFAEGVPLCSAALIESQWLLTTSKCLENVTSRNTYLVAKLGSKEESSKLIEREVKLIRIDGMRTIAGSDIALLHLSSKVNETDFVRSLGISPVLQQNVGRDVCIAVGDRTVLLEPMRFCADSSRCYRKINPSLGNCRSKSWLGVIACQSRLGWYPASVYSERSGHCGFKNVTFTNVQERIQVIRQALTQKAEMVPEPICSGFRCLQGSCIPLSKKCNGWPDCPFREDESADLCRGKGKRDCKLNELRCRNGRCIPKIFFGDGVDNCGDGSDEPAQGTCAEYLNLTAPERLCDGKRNCYDKSDEQYRVCGCNERKFQCHRSGYCVPKDFVCDGEEDCPGGEDEEHCLGRKMIKSQEKSYVEILENSYGVWHAACPSEISKEHSDSLCKDLGYREALFTYVRNQTVATPVIDAFSWVKLNVKTHVALRGDRPFVSLVNRSRTCASVKCA